MTDTHRQLLDRINTIQSDETPCSSYEDTDTYRKTLADASVMLEDEIEKLKSRIAQLASSHHLRDRCSDGELHHPSQSRWGNEKVTCPRWPVQFQ